MPWPNNDVERKEAVKMYLMKQVFRSSFDGHVSVVDLGIYTSIERMQTAAHEYVAAHPQHPDTPYHIYAWPCVVDSEAHVLDDEIEKSKGFYVVY